LDQLASLVVCILGHRDKGVVFGVDGIPVLLNRLQYGFNSAHSPALEAKPKVFVILACQGNHDQLILERPDLSRIPSTLTMMPPVSSSATMPPLIGLLSLMSTIEEFKAWLSIKFIETFIIVMKDKPVSRYSDLTSASLMLTLTYRHTQYRSQQPCNTDTP